MTSLRNHVFSLCNLYFIITSIITEDIIYKYIYNITCDVMYKQSGYTTFMVLFCFCCDSPGTEWKVKLCCGCQAVTTRVLPHKWWWRGSCGGSRARPGTTLAEKTLLKKSGSGRKSKSWVLFSWTNVYSEGSLTLLF